MGTYFINYILLHYIFLIFRNDHFGHRKRMTMYFKSRGFQSLPRVRFQFPRETYFELLNLIRLWAKALGKNTSL